MITELTDRMLRAETHAEDGLLALARQLAEDENMPVTAAIAIVRAIRYVIAHQDERDVQLAIGTFYIEDLERLAR